jgi:hypothetical protein
MRRTAGATLIAVAAISASACGGGHKQHVTQTRAAAPRPVIRSTHPNAEEVLSLTGLGTFEGRCPRGARVWLLRFIDNQEATDTVSYRVGTGARRTVNVNPSRSITVQLVPGATTTHEPADRFVPPVGQGRGPAAATSVPSTVALDALIYQGTEPQTLRADIHLALTTIGGESGQCVLVGSTVSAYTYPN